MSVSILDTFKDRNTWRRVKQKEKNSKSNGDIVVLDTNTLEVLCAAAVMETP